MRIVMYGAPLGVGGYLTEIPFLIGNKIERIYKDAVDLQDLEADIAIANFTRDPLNSGNETGWNYLRLPKVKVQLAIQAEHFDEYIPEWVDGITHNFDGSICYDFNKPFWEFDDSIHPCFAREYWDKVGAKVKPRFYFDPLVKWNGFMRWPVDSFSDYGYIVGSETVHRSRIVKSNPYKYRYQFGDMRSLGIQAKFRIAGIAWNVHKFQLKGVSPETDGLEVKYLPKTEAIKLAYFYNLGMAIVTEKLDNTFPERLKHCIVEVDKMDEYEINYKQLNACVLNSKECFDKHHDLDCELDLLLAKIKKEFNL